MLPADAAGVLHRVGALEDPALVYGGKRVVELIDGQLAGVKRFGDVDPHAVADTPCAHWQDDRISAHSQLRVALGERRALAQEMRLAWAWHVVGEEHRLTPFEQRLDRSERPFGGHRAAAHAFVPAGKPSSPKAWLWRFEEPGPRDDVRVTILESRR